ncbi:hypothetical protein B0T16DRAFT_69624 [Cercophora newfieldiana]|uniref:DUF7779 domain-containing protein n=1 Tax=Cercophora newfieldiana TaxID=92897 RepID=A0AA40D2J2_9PEZI|nr:hypothetical protein B0T16DRAFT_69624 [Cercophora newfieldiana]
MALSTESAQTGLESAMRQSEVPDFDAIYVEAWNSVIAQCQTRLERVHLVEAMAVKNPDDFRRTLVQLQNEHSGSPQVSSIVRNLLPTLGHYEEFASTFVKLMKGNVETSMMWGLLSLVIRFSLDSPKVRDRATDLVRRIGHKLDYLNEYGRSSNDSRMKEVSAQVHTDLVHLWLNIITVFKDTPEGSLELKDVISQFDEFMGKLDDAVARIKDIVNLALAIQMRDRENFHSRMETLSLSGSSEEVVETPHYRLPAARNPRFFGRNTELKDIRSHLAQQSVLDSPASLLLYGMGGVGKSEIALHYALDHMKDYRVILWFHAADSTIEASFSDAAVELKIPDTKKDAHPQNRVRLLQWLQRTKLHWLLIYDNVESADVLQEFWPVAKQGAILLTSRKYVFAMQPANGGIEILPFSVDAGLRYVLGIISGQATGTTSQTPKLDSPKEMSTEVEAAQRLSEYLGGHPLALTQASSLAWRRKWPTKKLVEYYQKFPRVVHQKLDPVLLHAGYSLSMSTVFLVSFESLSDGAIRILTIMSFFQPDQIPEDIFVVEEGVDLPPELEFLRDEMLVSDCIQELTDLSLVRRASEGDRLSVHQLVQMEVQHYAKTGSRQMNFDLAARVLCVAFPHQQDERFGGRLLPCSRYIQHVYALRDNFLLTGRGETALQPSDSFCVLLRNASWYCVEIHNTKELGPTVQTAIDAARLTGFVAREPRHYAQLCNCASRLWAQRGNFDKALELMLECKSIRERINADLWSAINNLGNIYFSQGKSELALETHKQCMALYEDETDMPRHALRMNRLNRGRTLTVLGRYDEAAVLIRGAEEVNDDWLMAIHIKYHFCLLQRARGNLEESIHGLEAAIEEIKAGQPYQSLLDAACHYKIGCILFQMGKPDAAIYLQRSYDIHRLRGSLPCEVARVAFMLANALSGSFIEEDIQRASRLREEAERIRGDLGGLARQEPASEATFDSLVDGQLR